jgi:anti-sigma B factor antagonist
VHTIICTKPSEAELDLSTAPTLRRQLLALESPAAVLVDMSDVALCDSSGITALLEGWEHQYRHGGTLQLSGTQPFVHRILTLAGVIDVLDGPVLADTLDDWLP